MFDKLDQPWPNLAKPGQTWPNLAKPGQTWPNLAKLGQTWPNLAKPGQTWPIVVKRRHGQTWPNLAKPGQTWPNLAKPGQSWPKSQLLKNFGEHKGSAYTPSLAFKQMFLGMARRPKTLLPDEAPGFSERPEISNLTVRTF